MKSTVGRGHCSETDFCIPALLSLPLPVTFHALQKSRVETLSCPSRFGEVGFFICDAGSREKSLCSGCFQGISPEHAGLSALGVPLCYFHWAMIMKSAAVKEEEVTWAAGARNPWGCIHIVGPHCLLSMTGYSSPPAFNPPFFQRFPTCVFFPIQIFLLT